MVIIMALATWEDVQLYVGTTAHTFSTDEENFVTAVLGYLEDEMITILGRDVEQQTVTEYQTLTREQNVIFAQDSPVATVSSFTILPGTSNALVVDPAAYTVYPWGIEFADAPWTLAFIGPEEKLYDELQGIEVEIVYVGGLPPNKAERLVGTLVRAAAREYLARANDAQNVSNLHAGRMMDYTFSDQNLGEFTEAERKKIRRYKRRSMG